MDTWLIANILRLRRTLRRREGWTRERLLEHQQHELATLRAFAAERSPFYRRLHHGLGAAPLAELPVLTKATMMGHFDEIVTDPTLHLAGLQTYLEQLHGNEPFAGRYWVSATSGSSGRKSVIPGDAHEWAMTIASYSGANEWSGIQASPLHPVRMTVVSSTTAWHWSSRVAATVRSPFIHSERMDAAAPLPDIAARLNQLRPDILIGYASMIRTLAGEQLAGRLRIAPRTVNSASEVLTAETRAMATRAWGVPPFNVYAATETGGIAGECAQHQGMHLFEDLIIAEVVDDAYRPVPPGQPGDRLLVTVLFSRTLPLIRYEMTDLVTLATEPCPDGCRSASWNRSTGAPTTLSCCPHRPVAAPASTPSCSTASWTCSTHQHGRYASTDPTSPCSSPPPARRPGSPPPKRPYAPPSPRPAPNHRPYHYRS
jgi:phenylacetate-CoA ligase